jgi:hypothetical protein
MTDYDLKVSPSYNEVGWPDKKIKEVEFAKQDRLDGMDNHVNGMTVADAGGLGVTIAIGDAKVYGYLIENDTEIVEVLTNNATNHVYLVITLDVNGRCDSATIVINTTGTTPAYSTKLATIVCADDDITSLTDARIFHPFHSTGGHDHSGTSGNGPVIVGKNVLPASTTAGVNGLGVVRLSRTPDNVSYPSVLSSTEKGGTSGVCALDANQRVPLNNLPAVLVGKDIDTLDTYHAVSFELVANKGIALGYCDLDVDGLIPLNRFPTILTGKTAEDADKLDTYHAASFELVANKGVALGYCGLNASLQIALANIPATLIGKDSDSVDTYHAADLVLAATRDINSGIPVLSSIGHLLVKGSKAWLARNESNQIYIGERTAAEDVLRITRAGTNAYTCELQTAAAAWSDLRDADKVDTYHAASFLFADGSNSMVGDLKLDYTAAARIVKWLKSDVDKWQLQATDSAFTLYDDIADRNVLSYATATNVLNLGAGTLTHGAATIWDSANDGSGSGCDSDMVDGNEAAAFMFLNGANSTMVGDLKLDYVGATRNIIFNKSGVEKYKIYANDSALEIYDSIASKDIIRYTQATNTLALGNTAGVTNLIGTTVQINGTSFDSRFVLASSKGAAYGVCPLNGSGQIDVGYVPGASYATNAGYATSAGSASSASYATSAGTASNSAMVDSYHAVSFELAAHKGVANGYAPLNASGYINKAYVVFASYADEAINADDSSQLGGFGVTAFARTNGNTIYGAAGTEYQIEVSGAANGNFIGGNSTAINSMPLQVKHAAFSNKPCFKVQLIGTDHYAVYVWNTGAWHALMTN